MYLWCLLILIYKVNLIEWEYAKLPKLRLDILNKHKFRLLILVMVNEYHCLDCKEIVFQRLQKLKDEQLIIDNNFVLVFISDVADTVPSNYYGTLVEEKEKSYFYIFTTHKKTRFYDFNDYILSDDLYGKTLKFIRNYVETMIEIESLKQFNDEFNEKRLIFVYFGGDNPNYKRYLDFIREDKDHRNQIILPGIFKAYYYFTFDKKLRRKILKQFKSHDSGKDIIGVFRHSSYFNKYDHKNLILINDLRSRFKLKRYLTNFRYEKLRDCTDHYSFGNLISSMIREHLPALIYINEKDEMTVLRREFEKVVHLVPKMLAFGLCICPHYVKQLNSIFKTKTIGEHLYFFPGTITYSVTKYNQCNPTSDSIMEFLKREHEGLVKNFNYLELQETKGLNINFDNFDKLINL